MKIFQISQNDSPSSLDLKIRLDSDMDYLEIDKDIQKGFLFFLGASLNIGFNKSLLDLSQFNNNEEESIKNLGKLINLYSNSSGNFSDYGELNDYVFSSYIYSVNHVIINILGQSNVDNHLRKAEVTKGSEPIIIGKTKLIDEFVKPYIDSVDSNFKLNDYHNLIELFFKGIGKHLTENDFDKCKSYEAGYAYYSMQSQMDIKGTSYMIEAIFNFLTPMYKALHMYPILYYFQKKNFDTNHIFSNILQVFYGGIDQKIIMPIHQFHQHIFYSAFAWKFSLEKTSSNFSWKFNLKEDVKFQNSILSFASRIKESGLVNNKKIFIDSKEVFNKDLYEAEIDIKEFYSKIFLIIYEKYHIAPTNGNGGWNNLGDFIQYCAILFYETCLHAAIVNDLNLEYNNEKK